MVEIMVSWAAWQAIYANLRSIDACPAGCYGKTRPVANDSFLTLSLMRGTLSVAGGCSSANSLPAARAAR
jgi:hypothetical protein